jgi:hypothetical protein
MHLTYRQNFSSLAATYLKEDKLINERYKGVQYIGKDVLGFIESNT